MPTPTTDRVNSPNGEQAAKCVHLDGIGQCHKVACPMLYCAFAGNRDRCKYGGETGKERNLPDGNETSEERGLPDSGKE